MRILVLGGAGYIGSHFVKAAVKNHEVVVIDNLKTGHQKAIDKQARFYEGDIRDKDFMRRVFDKQKIDIVVHFAASSLVGESMEMPLAYFDNNVFGTLVMLETMAEFKVDKIVFSSSAAVYGAKKEMPITEAVIPEPTNPYGETKLMMERMMKWAEKAHGIRYVSLRYFNVAGASTDGSIGEDHRPETHLIPIILQVPLGKRKDITIFGDDYDTFDGTCIRDYIHIEDLVEAHLLAAKHLESGNPSDIFNLGSQNGYSNLEIVEAAGKITGAPIPYHFGPRRPGDPDKLVASNAKAKAILGWEPKHSLGDVIGSAWVFHREQPEGFGE